ELLKYIKELMENDPIKILIKGGENDKLEFKSTLRWNQKEDIKDWSMEYMVMKTIAAFINSFGGTLLIGVKDDGTIIGIEADKFPNEDKYLLHFSNLIKKYIGLEYSECINYLLVDVEGKKIMKVDCYRHIKPIFLKLGDKEEFYIRSESSSIKLQISKVIKYIDNHFPNS
ncbi:ATP-binding protein, partial [candidate division WOR-3 bacterium]|nr:ATP-binding protein [candidate division WOR-3 bacterium]